MRLKLFMAVLLITLVFPSGQMAPVRAQAGTIQLTFQDIGTGDVQLKGLYASADVWIPFQSNWIIEDALAVAIHYTASPLLNPTDATLTVLANNQQLTSIRPAESGTIPVSVPVDLLGDTGVLLSFKAHLRITNEPCEYTNNPGQWLIIQKTSTITMSLQGRSGPPTLAELPDAIFTQSRLSDPPPVVFVLPENPDPVTLTTAAQVAARLGSGLTVDHLPLTFATSNTLTDDQKNTAHLVLVGTPDGLPLIAELDDTLLSEEGQLMTSTDEAMAEVVDPSAGVVQIIPSPWNAARNVLLVTASAESGLVLAGRAFADADTIQFFSDTYEIIEALQVRPAPLEPPAWTTDRVTFDQLGDYDRTIEGVGMMGAYYYFRRPSGWILDAGSRLTLHVAFSPTLREADTFMVIYINDIYIGTIDITAGDGDRWVALELPARALNNWAQSASSPRSLDLKAMIASPLPHDGCEMFLVETNWVKIYADSYFDLPHTYDTQPDLHSFPYPYVNDVPGNSPVAIVLPIAPTQADYDAALSLAAILGEYAPQDFDLSLTTADQVTSASHADYHLIMIGQQPLRESFLEGTELPAEVMALLDYPQTGIIQATTSPWNSERSVLMLYGDTELSYQAFYERIPPVNETGAIAMVQANQDPVIVYRVADMFRPVYIEPDVIQSEVSELPEAETPSAPAEPTAAPTAVAPTGAVITDNAADEASLSEIEQLILMITAFLIVLISLAALGRIIFRLFR
ncbi:MAG: cellulose biosynthesis cyclic di-GMP-binding regulatory protein BcsB [Anaerolineae bacterium]|nr:cellulose biosynthesis cyclic di-GMP-binding regulatory protein BcsB [Anaerolineae bacterium]